MIESATAHTHPDEQVSACGKHVAIELGAVRRGRIRVLNGWAGALPRPTVCGLVGLNGAGKSSLMLALAGALRVSAARAEVSHVAEDGTRRPATLALTTQESALPPWLDAASICRLHGLELEALIGRYPGLLLGELGTKRAESYSGGQAQALAVGLALGADADLTMLDEPLASLDVRRRRALLDALQERRAGGAGAGAVLLSSQAAADLHATCDRLVVLSGGQVVFDGETESLMTGVGTNGGGAAEGSARLEAWLLALAGGPQEPPAVPTGGRPR